jgi:hypothetical protein
MNGRISYWHVEEEGACTDARTSWQFLHHEAGLAPMGEVNLLPYVHIHYALVPNVLIEDTKERNGVQIPFQNGHE